MAKRKKKKKKMVVRGTAVGRLVCVCVSVQTWISGDPLPGHRASSTPGCAVGAVARWPWPASPG